MCTYYDYLALALITDTSERVFPVNRAPDESSPSNLELCYHIKEAWNIHEVHELSIL
jgi:hypothetical protein